MCVCLQYVDAVLLVILAQHPLLEPGVSDRITGCLSKFPSVQERRLLQLHLLTPWNYVLS